MNNTESFNWNRLNMSASISVTIIALIGNSIVFYVLSKPAFKNKSIFRYLLVATIVDTVNAIQIWPSNFPDFFLINTLDIACKLWFYLGNVFGTYTSWLNIVISLDTLFAVKFPRKFSIRKTYKFQLFVLLVLFVILCLLYTPFLIYQETLSDVSGCTTETYELSYIFNVYFLK